MDKEIKFQDILHNSNNALWISDERQKGYLQYALSQAGAFDRKAIMMPQSDFYYTIDGAKTTEIGADAKTYTMLDVDFNGVLNSKDNRDMEDMLHYPLTILEFANDYREKAIGFKSNTLENLIRTALELAGVRTNDGKSFLSDEVALNPEDNGALAITNRGRILSRANCIKQGILLEDIYNVGMSSILTKEQMIGLVNGKTRPNEVVDAAIKAEKAAEVDSLAMDADQSLDESNSAMSINPQDYDFESAM